MFSPRQRAKFFPLFDRAWREHSASHGLDPADRKAADSWRHAELYKATGRRSIRLLNQADDFNRCMAWFEAICGDSIYWQLQLDGQNLRYIRHAVGDETIEESYCRGIAKQALQLSALPNLSDLTQTDLKVVIRALAIQQKRAEYL